MIRMVEYAFRINLKMKYITVLKYHEKWEERKKNPNNKKAFILDVQHKTQESLKLPM